jgi:hypothetical protein
MAKTVTVLTTLVCDAEHDAPTEGSSTVTFALNGTTFEVDLCDEHLEELHEAFDQWTAIARPAGRGGGRKAPARARRSGGTSSRASRGQLGELREWARANGYQVSDRGRISSEVKSAYEAAQSKGGGRRKKG